MNSQKVIITIIIILIIIILYKKYVTMELYQPIPWQISDAKMSNWNPYWLTNKDTNFPIVPGVSNYNYNCANPFNTVVPEKVE